MRHRKSRSIYERALRVMPSGVSALGRILYPFPIFMDKSHGSHVVDVDGNEYVDYLMSFGALILGHREKTVTETIASELEKIVSPGTVTEPEVDLAEKITSHIQACHQIRFTNSGTEAVMYALRVARGYMKKDKVAKFEGGFHGNHDYALFSIYSVPGISGDELNPENIPTGIGVPSVVKDTIIVLPFNNIEATKEILEKHKDELAAVIVEPVLGFGGGIPADRNFLVELRRFTKANNILLIFDEVITAFRLAIGGAQEYFGVEPDLVTLGKIIGGGFPIGAFGGRRDIMEIVAPANDLKTNIKSRIFQSGTFNGHPLAMVAGLATIEQLEQHGHEIYNRINRFGDEMRRELNSIFSDARISDLKAIGISSIFTIVPSSSEIIRNTRDIEILKRPKVLQFSGKLINNGIYLPPVHGMISSAHNQEDIDKTLKVATLIAREKGASEQ